MPASGARAPIFPLPNPSAPHPPSGDSRRCKQRFSESLLYHNLSLETISSLNHLSASYGSASVPLPHPKNISLARNSTESSAVSLTQSRMLSHVQRCATRFGSRRADSSESALCDADPVPSLADMNLLSKRLRNADLSPYTNKPNGSNSFADWLRSIWLILPLRPKRCVGYLPCRKMRITTG